MYRRSEEDAKAWVEKAKGFYLDSGKRIALAEFSNPNGDFVNGGKLIFVLNRSGTMMAHGTDEKSLGREFRDLSDSNGKLFIQEIIDTANQEGRGWIEYHWYHPQAREWLPRIGYFEKIEDLIICSAVHKDISGSYR
jgi:cytochrome c